MNRSKILFLFATLIISNNFTEAFGCCSRRTKGAASKPTSNPTKPSILKTIFVGALSLCSPVSAYYSAVSKCNSSLTITFPLEVTKTYNMTYASINELTTERTLECPGSVDNKTLKSLWDFTKGQQFSYMVDLIDNDLKSNISLTPKQFETLKQLKLTLDLKLPEYEKAKP